MANEVGDANESQMSALHSKSRSKERDTEFRIRWYLQDVDGSPRVCSYTAHPLRHGTG